MNAVGRQMARSNSAMQHQRQYSETFFPDASSRWLQSSGLSQDFAAVSRSSSMGRLGDDPVEHSPGLLDLHSFDTELLPHI